MKIILEFTRPVFSQNTEIVRQYLTDILRQTKFFETTPVEVHIRQNHVPIFPDHRVSVSDIRESKDENVTLTYLRCKCGVIHILNVSKK